MKSLGLTVLLALGLFLSGCGEFGRGAPSYNSTWNYTFGKGELARPAKPPTPPQPPQVPAPQNEIRPAVAPTPVVEPSPSPSPSTSLSTAQNPNIDWEQVNKDSTAHPLQLTSRGTNIVSRTYRHDDGVLRLDKEMPAEVEINAPFEYTIKVTNETKQTVENIVVREHVAQNFKVLGSHPQALIEHDTLVWKLGAMGARTYKLIRVRGVATTMTRVAQCATMTFGSPVCATSDVVKPELILIKVLPDEALICEPIPMRIGVKNIGSGTAQNVVIHDVLPTGMRSASGGDKLTFNVGNLGPGQAQEFTASLKATRRGEYQNKATATADNAAKVESALVGVTVGQPVLEISKVGPTRRLLKTPIRYQITLKNSGDVVAQDLVLEDEVPTGLTPFKANYGGKKINDKMVWHLPPLLPSQSLTVEVVYQASEEGTYTGRALARAICVDPVSATGKTLVQGIAAILLEVVDVEDPIEIGGYETYYITTTSQGSSDSTNVHIVCTLEDNMAYVSAEGPTPATVQGNKIEFAPLPRLSPRNRATWKVVVRAIEPGDVRFKVTLNTDQLQRPVEETESTEMYE